MKGCSGVNVIPKNMRSVIRLRIAEWYCMEYTAFEIANELEKEYGYQVSRQQIHKYIKSIKADWHNEALNNVEERIEKELSKINTVEREYWREWQRSKEKKRTEIKTGGTSGKGVHKKATVKTEIMMGDPSYLSGIERCIKQRREMLGLDAPIKSEQVGQPQIIIARGRREETPEPDE